MDVGRMGYEINWHTNDASVLRHPFYITYSVKTLTQCKAAVEDIKSDVGAMLMSNESAPIIAYGEWLLRSIALV